jgi:M6 family metalloprotease-like protein
VAVDRLTGVGRLVKFALASGLGALGVLLLADHASAAPVRPVTVTLVQPDGSTIRARPWGDEHASGYETLDGRPVTRGSDGYWRGSPDRSSGAAGSSTATTQVAPAPPGGVHTGSENLLVILAKYSNTDEQTSPADWQSKFFGTAGRTVRTFYRQSSYNTFDVVPAAESCGTANDGIAGWMTLGTTHPNIKLGDSSGIADDAVAAVESCVDFDSFDADNSGSLSARELHIIVILAGYETSYTGTAPSLQCGPSVWGHNTDFFPPVFADGNRLSSYSMFGEMHCYKPFNDAHQATIGIMVHEFGHDIGWPDLYDIDGSSEGVGEWSVMSSGSWAYSGPEYAGASPSLPDAFSRSYQGWVTPTLIGASTANEPIDASETNADIYQLLANPNGVDWSFDVTSGTGEYFLIENRNAPVSGFDAGLPGCGLLVWHIDETRSQWNDANSTENRPLVKLVQADGLNALEKAWDRGDSGDPFPGYTGNADWNDGTTPSSSLYGGIDSGVGMHVDSSSCAATIQADLLVGPSVRINNVGMSEGNRGQRTYVFTVSLSRAPTAPLSVNVATADGTARSTSDYTANATTLSFNVGEMQKTFTVFVRGDRRRERNERFRVNLTNLTGDGSLADALGVGVIRNDD